MGLAQAFAQADRMVTLAEKAGDSAAPTIFGRQNGLNALNGMLGGGKETQHANEQYHRFRDWCYACVSAKAKRAAGQPILIGRAKADKQPKRSLDRLQQKCRQLPVWELSTKAAKDELDVLESHALLDLIDDPNELMVRWTLLYVTVASLELTGKAYWWLVNHEGRQQIWPVPTSWMTPEHEGGKFNTRWRIKPPQAMGEGEAIPGDQVAYFYYPDPSDPFAAISPLQAMSRAVSADESVQVSQAMHFKNAIQPGYAIVIGDQTDMNGRNLGPPVLEDYQREQIVYPLLQYYRGVLKAGEPFVLDGLVKDVKKITPSVQEMDYQASGEITKQRILAGFGVNETILGLVENANRASAAVADHHFCGQVLNPLLELMSQVLTAWVGVAFAGKNEKLVAWIEPCKPNDTEALRGMYDAAAGLKVISVNEYRRDVMGLGPVEGGDIAIIDAGKLPMTLAPEGEGKGSALDVFEEAARQAEQAAMAAQAAKPQGAAPAKKANDCHDADGRFCSTGGGGRWSPTMTPQQADKWSDGSAFSGQPMYHYTRSQDNVDGIKREGFNSSKVGLCGSGIYLTDADEDPSGEIGRKSPVRMEVRTRANKPLVVHGMSGIDALMESNGIESDEGIAAFVKQQGFDSIRVEFANKKPWLVLYDREQVVAVD